MTFFITVWANTNVFTVCVTQLSIKVQEEKSLGKSCKLLFPKLQVKGFCKYSREEISSVWKNTICQV